ncbi:MAG: hypothetical protein ACYTGN_16530 [Planctomycetota bacterium]
MEADGRRAALTAIYAAADRAIAGRPELFCELSGRCCRFREAGHELFLTRLEYERMAELGGPRDPDPAACPWLENGLCANREGRALGCRTYFCSDEAAAAEVTEVFHREIRTLHERLGIPYAYRALYEQMTDDR